MWFFRYFSRLKFFRRSLEIYTDGSHKDGVGSWAFVITRPTLRNRGAAVVTEEKSGRIRRASSNTMEFHAAIEALKSIPLNSTVTLFSDSKILIDTMLTDQDPTGHEGQIAILRQLSQLHNVKWQWIKGHRGNKFNERCDKLCTLARS